MPTLDWIGKQAVINHHREVPYRLLHCDGALSAGVADAGNLLVQGENLEALRALLPYYAGKVKCIYIDPPYNTGNEEWVYNDNNTSPEIKAWLGNVVGREAEDLSRHDKWLCMMYPRLRLLREFLLPDGAIFVSIDDGEVSTLRLMMDTIFKADSFIGQFVWKSRQNRDNRNISGASIDHEYILAYGKGVRGDDRNISQYSNPDNDSRGDWASGNMVGIATAEARPNLHYDLVNPATGINYGCPSMGWRYGQPRMAQLIAESRILWPSDPSGRPRVKVFLNEMQRQFTGFSSIVGANIYTRDGTADVLDIFGTRVFDFPKPKELIKVLIKQATESDDLILDSFAGSGTTGQAVLELNKEDGGNRRFILVEMKDQIATTVTAERLRRVINGYNKRGDETRPVEGVGNGFRFCKLGVPLFDEFGDIASEVKFEDLAAHIFFSETGVPIPKRAKTQLLGVHQTTAVYLLFNETHAQIPREAVGNVLTPDRLLELPSPPAEFEGVKVVYAEGCTVSSDRLKAANIVFKQIPYQIEGF